MKLSISMMCACATAMLSATIVAQVAPSTTTAARPTAAPAHAAQQHVNEGQRIFEQNCSRCHNPPDGFSQHISSTVVRHMRVRANLSEHDMKELMKFFHP
jgi:mono/diheme cytochrome c family protein